MIAAVKNRFAIVVIVNFFLAGIHSSLLCAASPNQERAATAPLVFAPISDAMEERITASESNVSDADRRGYYQVAVGLLKDELAFCEPVLGANHFLVCSIKSRIELFNWAGQLPESDKATYRRARDKVDVGHSLLEQNDTKSALNAFEEAARLMERLGEPDNIHKADRYLGISTALLQQGKVTEALAAGEKGRQITEKAHGKESPAVAQAIMIFYSCYTALGKNAEECRALATAYRIRHADGDKEKCAKIALCAAYVFYRVRDYERTSRCLDEVERLIENQLERLGEDEYLLTRLRCMLLKVEGRFKEAATSSEKLVQSTKKKYGAGHLKSQDAEALYGHVLVELGDVKNADDLLTNAYTAYDNRPGERFAWQTAIPERYCSLLLAQHRDDEAITILSRLISKIEKDLDPNYSSLWRMYDPYATALNRVGRREDAAQIESKSAQIQKSLAETREALRKDPACHFAWEVNAVSEGAK